MLSRSLKLGMVLKTLMMRLWQLTMSQCVLVVLHVFAGGSVTVAVLDSEATEFDGVAACKFHNDDAGFDFAARPGQGGESTMMMPSRSGTKPAIASG
eukprot:3085741-Rhodomonas_salina.2